MSLLGHIPPAAPPPRPPPPPPPRGPGQTGLLQPYLRGTSRRRTVRPGPGISGGPDRRPLASPSLPGARPLWSPGLPAPARSRMRARHAPTCAGKRARRHVGLRPSRRSRRASSELLPQRRFRGGRESTVIRCLLSGQGSSCPPSRLLGLRLLPRGNPGAVEDSGPHIQEQPLEAGARQCLLPPDAGGRWGLE